MHAELVELEVVEVIELVERELVELEFIELELEELGDDDSARDWEHCLFAAESALATVGTLFGDPAGRPRFSKARLPCLRPPHFERTVEQAAHTSPHARRSRAGLREACYRVHCTLSRCVRGLTTFPA